MFSNAVRTYEQKYVQGILSKLLEITHPVEFVVKT